MKNIKIYIFVFLIWIFAGGTATNALELERKVIYFHISSHRLTLQSQNILDNFLKAATGSGKNYLIIGHADERGASDYNLHLGDLRARAVLRYLVAHGSDPEKFIILSRGEAAPTDCRHASKAWRANRRVELLVW
ncbi:MAG: OmpA family protein [Deltaproteobacteria bacterium]|nr:OmpA family protein [Deltaproteobacteria bacterium]